MKLVLHSVSLGCPGNLRDVSFYAFPLLSFSVLYGNSVHSQMNGWMEWNVRPCVPKKYRLMFLIVVAFFGCQPTIQQASQPPSLTTKGCLLKCGWLYSFAPFCIHEQEENTYAWRWHGIKIQKLSSIHPQVVHSQGGTNHNSRIVTFNA